MTTRITYYRRGLVERPSRRRYVWKDGYSANGTEGMLYPWLTKKEARADAKQQGAQAVFEDDHNDA